VKPSVLLEFDLADVKFMRPGPIGAPGTPAPKDTLVIRDKLWGQNMSVAIYVVLNGQVVVPVSIPDDTTVTLEVKG
jgi:hypothetical protein